MAYNFKDKSVAYELKRIANETRGQVSQPDQPSGNELIIVKAPTAGIVAISGTEITSGECTRMFVNTQPTQVDIAEDTSFTVEVFNTTAEDIAGDSYFQAARCGTSWVSVAGGGGGGGGGQQNFVIVANSGITAATWATAGTGTGDIWELATGGASWSAIGGASVDIRNPWEETIASGSRMVCYKDGDYYVVIQASCPAV